MRIKRITLSTRLLDLYGRDNYHLHIEEGREYWYYFSGENKISEKYGSGWYKLKVTYIRSGCMFFIFPDYPDMEEDFCAIRCFMASVFEFAEIDPIKDIIKDDEDNGYIKKYRFDDTRTVVKNWDNSEYLEINENELCESEKIFFDLYNLYDDEKENSESDTQER